MRMEGRKTKKRPQEQVSDAESQSNDEIARPKRGRSRSIQNKMVANVNK